MDVLRQRVLARVVLEVRRASGVLFLLSASACFGLSAAEAVEVRVAAASGGLSASSTRRLWSVIGEPAIGSSASSSYRLGIGFLQASAATVIDPTPPATPVVTDDGAFTQGQVPGVKAAASISGGPQAGATRRLWWTLGDSLTRQSSSPSQLLTFGFLAGADLFPLSPPSRLHARWSASDPESGIVEYQYAIGTTPGGTDVVPWTSVGTGTELIRSDLALQDGRAYYISVRARNGAGQWSSAGTSDGITVDTTPPSTPVVTDDGAATTSTTQLHAQWTPSSDPESGIAGYEYLIRQDSTTGTIIVNYASAGTAREITRSGLSLTLGKLYFIGVRAKNGAGLYSLTHYSDGILVEKLSRPPVITSLNPADGSTYLEGDSVPIRATASDADGDPLQAQFLIDGVVKQPWSSSMSWSWNTAGFPRQHQLTVQVRDPSGQQAEKAQELFGYRRPIAEPTP